MKLAELLQQPAPVTTPPH